MLRTPRLCTLFLTRTPYAAVRTMSLFNTTRLQGETILITGASGGSSPSSAGAAQLLESQACSLASLELTLSMPANLARHRQGDRPALRQGQPQSRARPPAISPGAACTLITLLHASVATLCPPKAGANLLLLARRPTELKAVADECKAAWEAQPEALTGGKGGRFTTVECDMSRREDIDRALATVQAEVDSVEVYVLPVDGPVLNVFALES
jgi:hypothetical protein